MQQSPNANAGADVEKRCSVFGVKPNFCDIFYYQRNSGSLDIAF